MSKTTLFLSTGIFAIAIFFLIGCKDQSLAKADAAKNKYQYKYAGDLYSQAAPNIKNQDEAKRARLEAGNCYRMANDYEKAIKAYEKVLKKDKKNTEALYQLGFLKMKVADGNIDALREARVYFKQYLEEVPNDEKVLKKVAAIDSVESWRKDAPKSRFKVSNVKALNTKASDYCPMIASKKDDKIYFTSDREGGIAKKKIDGWDGFGFHDIWYADAKKIKKTAKNPNPPIDFGKPVLALGTINSKFNDGTCCFDRKFTTIYFTQCNGTDGKSKTCKLFQAKLNGTEWVEEQMLEFCINDSFNYGHPSLSDDGKKLYFSSDRDDGLGGYDIWVVAYNQRAKGWGDPINLGETINTNQNEMYPYWNSHDANLYFSSVGHLGMGGLDIFRSEGSGTEWTEPENLRAPLNSGGDDFGITYDINNPVHGYFTSNREGGKGADDIYEFRVEPLIIELEGYVYECIPNSNPVQFNNSKVLANSTITITNNVDSTKIIVKTDANGYYRVPLKEKTNYEILCQNLELYYFDAEIKQKTTKGIKISTVLRQDFCLLSQIVIRVVPIFYDLDKANIRPDAALVLDTDILPLMKKYPKLRLELGSHTDCRSSYAYNEDLSQRRADSAVAYLVRGGIDERRLVAKGYGESQLVNDCQCEGAVKVPCTEEKHQENRRTTIKTLDVNFDPKIKGVEDPNKNNTNVKPIIIKMTSKDNKFLIGTAGNNIESNGPSLVTPGADMTISLLELKNLIAKNGIKQTDLTGITMSDIAAGKLKPNATVKLSMLRLGPKDAGKTLNEVVLKIGTNANPYTIGFDALKKYNGSVNIEDGEILFQNINKEAMPNGAIDSKATQGGGTKPVVPAEAVVVKAADTVSLSDYKSVKLIQDNGNLMIPTMVNDKDNVNWNYDAAGRKVEMSEDIVKQLMESGTISKKDFEDGETIKLADGTKLRSNTFVIAKMQIGDVTLENVRVTVSSKVSVPTIGGMNMLLKKINAQVKGTTLYMKPKEKRVKPGE